MLNNSLITRERRGQELRTTGRHKLPRSPFEKKKRSAHARFPKQPLQLFCSFGRDALLLLQIGSWESNRQAGTRRGNRTSVEAAGVDSGIGPDILRSRSLPFLPPSLPPLVPFSVLTLVPSPRLLFHDGGSEFSQLRERDRDGCLLYEKQRVKLVVVPPAASTTPFLRSSAPLTMS